jgi:hypothetical protein
MPLRDKAEELGISKSGSVEVLRARLIQLQILNHLDLSWDGIQSMPHKEIGEVLKTFGIKSSGSHKERRQRLWLHLNFDSRRMTIERLAELDREKLHEMCQYLELPLTGNRTVLMGRVAGVLTSQSNGWGRIKRSLRRSGVSTISQKLVSDSELHNNIKLSEELDLDEEKQISEIEESSNAALEDAHDSLLIGFEDADFTTQGDILTIQARVEDLDRMISTIIKSHEGFWGEREKDLLLRLAKRRGWPLSNDKVKQRLALVATNIAEIKGAEMGVSAENSLNDLDTIERVRDKLSIVDKILLDKENKSI